MGNYDGGTNSGEIRRTVWTTTRPFSAALAPALPTISQPSRVWRPASSTLQSRSWEVGFVKFFSLLDRAPFYIHLFFLHWSRSAPLLCCRFASRPSQERSQGCLHRLWSWLQRQNEDGDTVAQDHGGQRKAGTANETDDRRGKEEGGRDYGSKEQSMFMFYFCVHYGWLITFRGYRWRKFTS